MKHLFSILAFSLFLPIAVASAAPTCNTIGITGGTVAYCVPESQATKRTAPPAVVYFFHGVGRGASDVDMGVFREVNLRLQAALGDRAPAFVGLSTGAAGVLRENSDELGATVIPALEKRLWGDTVRERHLIGASMGAHNAARLAGARPGAYKSVSLLCPALLSVDPYDPDALTAYEQRHAADLNTALLNVVLGVFHNNFPSRESWAANNPFEFMRSSAYDSTGFFLSSGQQDSLGFEEGEAAFAESARARGIPVVVADVPGPHCNFDGQALGNYLLAQLTPARSVR